MISTTETEASVVKQENDAIRKALSRTGIPVSSPEQDTFTINFQPQQNPSQSLAASLPNSQNDSQWHSDSSLKSMVSVNFDDAIKASCLHINPLNTYDPSPEILNSPDIFGSFSSSPSNVVSPQSAASSKSAQKVPTPQSNLQAGHQKKDMSTIAINFILSFDYLPHHLPITNKIQTRTSLPHPLSTASRNL